MKTKITLLLTTFLLLAAFSAEAQRSLYEDVKATRIGDVITVVLMENISGSSSTDASNRSGTSGQASASVTGNLSSFLPLFGANSSVDYQNSDRVTAQQSQLLRGNLSVRIEDVTPNGDLYVIGKRTMEINGEMHSVNLKGFVRPNDVDNFNRVPSYRVANAEIMYLKEDSFEHEKRRPGFVRRVIWASLGVAMGTAIAIKAIF